jgi:uncharacterized membrane protein YphA (DoxX/SURF4 family)
MSLLGTAILGVQGLLGVGMLGAGGTKLAGAESQVETFEHLGYPQWFRLVTGGLEVTAALALLVSFVVTPLLAIAGSVIVGVVLLGALGSHVKVGDEPREMVPAAVLLVLAAAVVWHHAGGVV